MTTLGRIVLPAFFMMAAALMLPAPAAHAAPLIFVADLSGANEVPPNASPATGFAIVTLDPTAQTLQINAVFSGLMSNDTGAHIHCCAALGTNAGVATTVPAFVGFPLGVTSGSYNSVVFDLTQPLIYNPAFVTSQGGLPQAEAALIAGIEHGQAYFNIHTQLTPGGEIRGQLSETPLPAALPLFASGLGAMGLFTWRRKRKSLAT